MPWCAAQVRAAAARLGYRPHPLLGELLTRVRHRSRERFAGSIVYLDTVQKREGIDEYHSLRENFRGARERSHELGYAMERVWLHEPGVTPERWAGVFRARGHQGIVICHLPRWDQPNLDLRFPTGDFACVTLNARIEHRAIHGVRQDLYGNTRLALHSLAARGCRRIGLALNTYVDAIHDHLAEAAYVLYQAGIPARERLPVLRVHNLDPFPLGAWITRTRPDAILSMHHAVVPALDQLGAAVSRRIVLALLTDQESRRGAAGIDRRCAAMGSAAVDLVVAQIQRGERGAPPVAKTVLIEGVWIEAGPQRVRRLSVPETRRP